ncbi:uncharacterized protein [Manis javanica]|uniref:uncharacterized protein n=1 Tax=Manis javanica TaxID=9974 RepID=UPI003C6CD6AD
MAGKVEESENATGVLATVLDTDNANRREAVEPRSAPCPAGCLAQPGTPPYRRPARPRRGRAGLGAEPAARAASPGGGASQGSPAPGRARGGAALDSGDRRAAEPGRGELSAALGARGPRRIRPSARRGSLPQRRRCPGDAAALGGRRRPGLFLKTCGCHLAEVSRTDVRVATQMLMEGSDEWSRHGVRLKTLLLMMNRRSE